MALRRPGLGAGFGRLWAAGTAGNLGDGVSRVTVALLAAGLTRDPLAVAVITALSYLPGLVLGLPLREVLVGMIEEYARHMGHVDLLRARIDGRLGQ